MKRCWDPLVLQGEYPTTSGPRSTNAQRWGIVNQYIVGIGLFFHLLRIRGIKDGEICYWVYELTLGAHVLDGAVKVS
jgi:hypothetical protein